MSLEVSAPSILRDPRFEAGRTLIQQGLANDGAIEIFSTLLEECIAKHGETSIQTAPAFYEYGNSLLRAMSVQQEGEMVEEENAEEARKAAGAAAEARATAVEASKPTEDEKAEDEKLAVASSSGDQDEIIEKEEEKEDEEDFVLALEMMENAYSILDECQTRINDDIFPEWTKIYLPRVLLGIGDCLSALKRHSDAADAYSRALGHRQAQLETSKVEKAETVEHLQCQRRVCEATVLIAEELLACPDGKDVVTSETGSLIVKGDEKTEYARGYYDKARDSLQDTVYLMGKLAAKKVDLGTEKEDVCFLATMIMGVGESLAAIDESEQEREAAASTEPEKKKARR